MDSKSGCRLFLLSLCLFAGGVIAAEKISQSVAHFYEAPSAERFSLLQKEILENKSELFKK